MLSTSLATSCSAAALQNLLSIEDAVSIKTFPINLPISISPDGTWVAYTLQQSVNEPNTSLAATAFSETGATWLAIGARVWLANTKTHEQFMLNDPRCNSWAPVWAPDGKTLAFYSDRGGKARLWVWSLNSKEARPLSDVQVHPIELYEVPVWSPDARYVFAKVLSSSVELNPGDAKPEPRSAPLVFDSPATASAVRDASRTDFFSRNFTSDLARFDLSTGDVTRLVRGRMITGWWVSPTGQNLAYSNLVSVDANNRDERQYNLSIINLEINTEATIAEHVPLALLGITVSWSPNGRRLAFVTEAGVDDPNPVVNCYVKQIDSDNAPLLVTSTVRPTEADFIRSPLWNRNGDKLLLLSSNYIYIFDLTAAHTTRVVRVPPHHIFLEFAASFFHRQIWSDIDDTVVIFERNTYTKAIEAHRLGLSRPLDSMVYRRDIALSTYPTLHTDVSADGNTIAYLAQSSVSTLDVWIAGSGFRQSAKLSDANPQLDKYTFGNGKLISWRADDGRQLHGAIILPAGYVVGRSYPLVVYLYGGSMLSDRVNCFGLVMPSGILNLQMIATRGYAVLAPDTPMGTDTPALDLLKDVMPGVERAVEMGIAKNDAIAVMGDSYGGYSALALLVQTSRFKAAVAISAITNLTELYAHMGSDGESEWIGWAEYSQGHMGGSVWQYRDKYIENSPFFLADRITTPVLLIHAARDPVPAEASRSMFVALRRLGKVAEYAEYDSDRHMPNNWPMSQQADLANRVVSWLKRYVPR